MKRIAALLVLLCLLCGCSADTAADVSAYAPSGDGSLTVFTCLDAGVYQTLVKEFEERTGIWVRVETGSAPELMARIAEGESCDLLLGCEADLLEANSALFRQVETDAELSVWCPEGSCWVPLSLRPVVIIYNTKLVRQNLPTGWDSLLSSAWRGEIAFADPAASDFSRTVLQILTKQQPDQTVEETLSAYAANLEEMLENTQDVVSRVADGRYCLAVVPADAALSQIADGAELAIVYPEEGTYLLADCAAIPVSCAQPENAEALLEFILGRDAQTHAEITCGRNSVLAELAQIPENPRFYDPADGGDAQAALLDTWSSVWGVAP